ncbi:MAG: D-ribose pyranase [Firmicutes bacterium]|nr:D-ribose pyranase [Bacillota bacterium]
MRRDGLLNAELLHAIAAMGHTDSLVVADAGLPAPPGVRVLDLAVVPGVPSVEAVARAVLRELVVEAAVWAEEAARPESGMDSRFREWLQDLAPHAETRRVPHEEFKRLAGTARLIVRTGEFTPYANLLLYGGVPF